MRAATSAGSPQTRISVPAGAGERLELALVEQARVDAAGERVQAVELAIRVALDDQPLHRALPDALERGERVADRQPVVGRLNVERRLAAVHVGRQQRDAQPPRRR